MKKYITGYTVVGYITSVIPIGFLLPLYRNGNELFFHELTANNQRIRSFKPHLRIPKRKSYKNIHTFVSYDGPQKVINDAAFCVFKHGDEITIASTDNGVFIERLRGLLPYLPTAEPHEHYLCDYIIKLIDHVSEDAFDPNTELTYS